jgi:peptidoglycan biosynthesis protein MviN/MurJ (putative lipid II flippase)
MYQVIAQQWHDFYIIAGTAAATLVGLLFVGLSLHLRVVLSRSEVRSLARITLANFGLVLLISLLMMIRQGATSAGTELLISGIVSLGLILPNMLAAGASRTRTFRIAMLIARIGLTVVAIGGVIAAGRLIAGGSYRAGLAWLAAVTIGLLIISLRNSWDLLVSVGSATLE